MGSSEEYLLRWDDFEANIATAFRGLRGDDEFSDIHLICPDIALSGGQAVENLSHQTLKAHKVILSTCSPYFRGLLRHLKGSETPFQVPFIVMRGVNIHHMASILDFMYYGEVNINQTELDTFLALAEELQVRGLTQKKGGQKDPSSGNAHAPPPKRRKTAPPPAAAAAMPPQPKNDNGAIKEELNEVHDAEPEVEDVEDVKDEEQYYEYEGQADYSVAGGGEDPGEGTSNYGNDRKDSEDKLIAGIDSELENMDNDTYRNKLKEFVQKSFNAAGSIVYICKICKISISRSEHAVRHIEGRHLNIRRYKCRFCTDRFRTRELLRKHVKRYHEEIELKTNILEANVPLGGASNDSFDYQN